jgi:microcompartment protein CcmL/EutN
MSHVIGRPNDDLLAVMLGHGAEPEQAFIRDSEQTREEGEGFDGDLPGEEPTVPEL